jgi:O-antigen ligase
VDELAVFLLMPLFYVIITYPLQSNRDRILTLIVSVSVILISMTHRAGMIRILLSYFIVLVYFIILKVKISKVFLYIIVFCLLLVPFYFLYQGVHGNNIFQTLLGESTADYSQEDLKIDTRTFLYSEVLQDLKLNRAFLFGKGIYGGYASDTFQTWNRRGVEVGFLQILLKLGIVGFIVYFILIFSAIFRALGKSKNLYLKCLALLLAGYFLMFFIENVIAFDLLNIVVWLAVGMCHSKELLRLSDNEIRILYKNGKL